MQLLGSDLYVDSVDVPIGTSLTRPRPLRQLGLPIEGSGAFQLYFDLSFYFDLSCGQPIYSQHFDLSRTVDVG
jgi:hypothetical protein